MRDYFIPDDNVEWVCTYPDVSDLPCYMCHEDLSCDCCYYAMHPSDLPEDFV